MCPFLSDVFWLGRILFVVSLSASWSAALGEILTVSNFFNRSWWRFGAIWVWARDQTGGSGIIYWEGTVFLLWLVPVSMMGIGWVAPVVASLVSVCIVSLSVRMVLVSVCIKMVADCAIFTWVWLWPDLSRSGITSSKCCNAASSVSSLWRLLTNVLIPVHFLLHYDFLCDSR